MTTYSSPLSPAPALTDETTLKVAMDCLLEHLPIEMADDHSTEDLFEILLRTASRKIASNIRFAVWMKHRVKMVK